MAQKKISAERLKFFVRSQAKTFLGKPNINSVGIGYKISGGKRTKQLSIQFTVDEKIALEGLESIGAEEIPKEFVIDNIRIPTDVIERNFKPSAKLISAESKLQSSASRKSFVDPIQPGVSISHPSGTAGTAGCVVYDSASAEPLLLSNWHVLHGESAQIGDPIVQPGPHDDNRIEKNIAGRLVRSHLGLAGDCAVAEIDARGLEDEIVELDVAIDSIGEPELDDKVVKSGRTTEVTHGIVTRVHVTAQINYGSRLNPNVVEIGCFEIEPDPRKPALNNEISMGGDSGSAWINKESGKTTTMMVGLHFAGEVGDVREHALACYPSSVFEKLAITPQPTSTPQAERFKTGYLNSFIGKNVFLPKPLLKSVKDDLLDVDGETVFHYTHFSLAMSKSRKLARWVAWNIDGGSLKRLGRKNIRFKKDPNLPDEAQLGNEIYKNNPLDRGHLARRADLTWGSYSEAQQANKDSFFFTNIAPQHADFNQSKAGGIWGEIENAIFANVDLEDLKVSVMAGPIFTDRDGTHRGAKIPRSFWKAIYFRERGQSTVRVRAYVLSQEDLVSGIEALELPEFAVFEVPVNDLQDMIGLDLLNAKAPRSSQSSDTESLYTSKSKLRRIESASKIIS